MTLHPKQVDAKSSYGRRYLTLVRSVTQWYQADEAATATPHGGSILEIGPGSGHTTWLLRSWGYQVTTLDFDREVGADITGDVTKLPLKESSFDCVLAAEVLEHLPFEEFEHAIAELKRVSRHAVIVTLPAPLVGIAAIFNLPLLRPVGAYLGIPLFLRHRFDGEHYWEVGKWGFSLGRVKAKFHACGLRLAKSFRPPLSRYCYFFTMIKQDHSAKTHA